MVPAKLYKLFTFLCNVQCLRIDVFRILIFLKSNIVKKCLLFIVAGFAITQSSCRKELATIDLSTIPANSTAEVTNTEFISLATKISLSKTNTNYGALISTPADADPYSFVTGVAGQLGLSCIRDKAPVPGNKKVKTLSSSYNILLNFSSIAAMPMKFRTDITAYKKDLESTISYLNTMPAVAIIENEESNKLYFSGTASDYIFQLKAAITVMHAHGIPVTNGGITSAGLKYLVYQDYLNRGMTTQANDYKKRMKIAVNSPDTQERAGFIKILLDNYAAMNLDYVNFHWRSSFPEDAQGLGETINYLKRVTRKIVITTEIGQYDTSPQTLTSTNQMCENYKLPFVIWYSSNDDLRSFPLQYISQLLTNTGIAYQGFIASK